MKKSKIIIPALGMLLLSTAASVTGTVAWFTTVSSANANITNFAVRKLGGDLSYVVAPLTGTQKSDASSDTSAIVLKGTNPALCDASYNHLTGDLWKANSNASAFSALESESDAHWSVTSADPAQVTYYAVSWQYTFTYAFGGDSTAMNLYFDAAASTCTGTQVTAASGTQTEQTYKGFRIAFINSAASRKVVWAENQASSNCHYVTATDTATGSYFNVDSTSQAGDLIDSTSMTAIAENGSGTTTRADYLGQFTTTTNTITIKCVAWFEGTDPNIVNGARMDQVSAAMTFYTRPLAS